MQQFALNVYLRMCVRVNKRKKCKKGNKMMNQKKHVWHSGTAARYKMEVPLAAADLRARKKKRRLSETERTTNKKLRGQGLRAAAALVCARPRRAQTKRKSL
ncbi:hypothetical protein EVAR_54386_1 [Eumeta japonica]|uniref:Uncharacterized protein n=1 Tax=Eumeta variegata TaxID=151549 RepID=A0A4C1Y7P9_EUMVA|nr:hypothetical protein EVAR_54386_1 [Eumeta japonica]